MTDFARQYDFQKDLICLFFTLLNHTRVNFLQILALHYSLAYRGQIKFYALNTVFKYIVLHLDISRYLQARKQKADRIYSVRHFGVRNKAVYFLALILSTTTL